MDSDARLMRFDVIINSDTVVELLPVSVICNI